jgi:hypothetical protein
MDEMGSGGVAGAMAGRCEGCGVVMVCGEAR